MLVLIMEQYQMQLQLIQREKYAKRFEEDVICIQQLIHMSILSHVW